MFKKSLKNKYLCISAGAVLVAGAAPQAQAQDAAANYPNRTIRYIVGYTPGGTSDMLARAVGQKLATAWGQQVIVDNGPRRVYARAGHDRSGGGKPEPVFEAAL